MSWLSDRLERVRWLATPLFAYVVVTLLLPVANGAAARPGFATHAAWILGGCAAAVLVALVAGALTQFARRGRATDPAED
jgi:ABC-type Co2+ transport system permease subunit